MYNIPLPSLRNLLKSFLIKKVNNKKLSKPWRLNNNQTSIFFSRSSFSILYLLSLVKKSLSNDPLIWLPNYFCNQAVNLLREEGFKIFFYPVLSDFKPDWLKIDKSVLENKPDIFLLVHYFGIINDITNSVKFCRINKCIFVEDSAHLLVPYANVGIYSDYCFYSLHKHLAVPDGSILISNLKKPKFISNEIFSDTEFFNSFIKKYKKSSFPFKWVIKRVVQKIIPSVIISKLTNKNTNSINYGSAEISNISRKLIQLDSKNINNYLLKIRKNFSFLKTSNFGKLESLFFNYIELQASNPYWAIIDLQNKNKQEKIKQHLISHYNILDWIDLPNEIITDNDNNKDIINRSKELLFIPIHQNVKEVYLKKISSYIINNSSIEFNDNIKLFWINNDSVSWTKLINKTKSPNLFQNFHYAQVKVKDGWNIERGLIKKETENLAIFQLLSKTYFGIKIIRLNRGPLFFKNDISTKDKVDILNLIKKSIKNLGFKIFFISPNLENNYDNYFLLKSMNFFRRNINPWGSSIINLSLTEEILRSNLNSKWRNQLVSSEKNNLNFIVSRSDSSLNFIMNEYSLMIKNGLFKGVNQNFYYDLFSQNPSNFFILKTLFNDQCVASALFLKNGNTVVYQIGWSNDVGRKLNAMNYLMWNTILEMKKNQFNFLDMGGINKNTTDGIIKFKDGVGGSRYELVGEYINMFI